MTSPLAERLLDAQVRWLVGQLTGETLPELVARDVDELLTIGADVSFGALADVEQVKRIARRLLEQVPPSAVGTTVTAMTAEVVHQGADTAYTLAEVIDRENVERLTDEALARLPLLEALLEDLTRSPLASASATRMLSVLVADVMTANRQVAERIPGLGGLVSVGASVTGRVMGVADKQFEALVGGKGSVFAMRRLNAVLVETLRDPRTRAAILEIFDLYADEPLPSVSALGDVDEVRRLADVVQDIVIAGAPTGPVLGLVDALVEGFFATYDDHPVTELIADLGLTRDDLVEHGVLAARRIIDVAAESGELERFVRDRLAPFWESDEVAGLLADG